jgi:hypothetical protein
MAESDCEVGVISDWGRRSGWNSSGGRKQTVVTVDKDRRIRWATVDRRRTEKVVESHAQDGITGEVKDGHKVVRSGDWVNGNGDCFLVAERRLIDIACICVKNNYHR